MKKQRQSKKPRELILVGTLNVFWWLSVLAMLVLLILREKGIIDIPRWRFWAFWIIGLILIYAGGRNISEARNEILKKAGHGVEAWGKSIGAEIEGNRVIATLKNRRVIMDIIKLCTFTGQDSAILPFTRIRVQYSGKLPCVMELCQQGLSGRRIKFFDEEAYREWRSKPGRDPRHIPRKVKIHGIKVPTAFPKEMIPMVEKKAKNIFDNLDIGELKSKSKSNYPIILRIEPEQVFFLQEGGLRKKEYLEKVVNIMISLAEKTEEEF